MSRPGPTQIERLRRALSTLPAAAAEVFRRHVIESEDYEAIAVDMGLTVAEVEGLLADAIVRIDRALRVEEGGGAS